MPTPTFEDAEKAIGARVELHLADGRVLEEQCDIPIGAAGPATRRDHVRIVREKFLACGGSPDVADALERLEDLTAADLAATIASALA